MSVEAVKTYLKEFGLDGKVQELPQSSATVELAAQALGTEPARIAKTLSFLTSEGPALIVAAGDVKIDNAKYRADPGSGPGIGGASGGRRLSFWGKSWCGGLPGCFFKAL